MAFLRGLQAMHIHTLAFMVSTLEWIKMAYGKNQRSMWHLLVEQMTCGMLNYMKMKT